MSDVKITLDMPSDEYHRLPSLSSSGARKLVPPSCPARFKWDQEHPPFPTDAFDFGHAAHRFVLGKGEDIALVDFPDWRTKAAKEARDDARARGLVPLLGKSYDKGLKVAQALRSNPEAAALFSDGEAEVSVEWAEDGIRRRARFDYLRLPLAGDPRAVVVEYKTADSASPEKWIRSAASYGYHQQAAWYLDAAAAMGHTDARFVFVVQEKTAPYLVTLVELDDMALEIGRHENQKAIDVFRQCVAADMWPGYADGVVTMSLPVWAESDYLDDVAPDAIEV